MPAIQVRTQSGEAAGEVQLDPGVFEAQVNVPVMHQVVRAQLASARAGSHKAKSRGEVRGGGKKPWRQKGTGRARQGSNRAPQWAGGGIVFGPTPRDHSMRVPKKMRQLALRSALSDRAREGRIAVIDRFAFDAPKTKEAARTLAALGVGGAKTLIVLDAHDVAVEKSFRNLMETHVIQVSQLNTYDVLASDWVLFTKSALDRVGGASTQEERA
jgi:large subunit ribosomal protein L4